MPAIDDNGFVLWESHAAVRYLYAKHAPAQTPEQRADADRWMEWFGSTLSRSLGPAFMGLIRTPPEKRDLAAIEASRKASSEDLRILETHLAGRAYVCGSEFTMGDIPLGTGVYRWANLPMERPDYPNIAAWTRRLGERPAYRKNVMIPLS